MTDGYGIFNVGVGERSILPCGKSRILNDILLPEHSVVHDPFSVDDKTPFASGQVDVFFDKGFNPRDEIVLMDANGRL